MAEELLSIVNGVHRPEIATSLENNPNNDNTIIDINQTVNELESSIDHIKNLDDTIEIKWTEQIKSTIQLENKLNEEKTRNRTLMDAMKDDCLSVGSTPRSCCMASANFTDGNSFSTVSTVLLQYKYDELSLSYRRCLKDLAKKDKQLKLVINENETLRTKLNDLQKKYRELHGKMEIVCCKYLYLHNRKDEEIIRLRKCLNYASFMFPHPDDD